MEPLRLNVMPRGKGYVAESRNPELTAVGSSPEEAAENARRMALALLANTAGPRTLIVRINEPGLRSIIMQPLDKRVFLAVAGEDLDWRYTASVTNGDALEDGVAE